MSRLSGWAGCLLWPDTRSPPKLTLKSYYIDPQKTLLYQSSAIEGKDRKRPGPVRTPAVGLPCRQTRYFRRASRFRAGQFGTDDASQEQPSDGTDLHRRGYGRNRRY